MSNRRGEQVVHSYDVARRRVLCGHAEQTSSTKHAAAVTCLACREMLDRAPAETPLGATARDDG